MSVTAHSVLLWKKCGSPVNLKDSILKSLNKVIFKDFTFTNTILCSDIVNHCIKVFSR